MPTALVDVNVLLALAWPSHEFHAPAKAWFDQWLPQPWATCPLTELAFIRLSSNPHVIPYAVKPLAAAELLRQFATVQPHEFWPNAIPTTDRFFSAISLRGHQQITDAYLVALAHSRGQKIATFDTRIQTLISPEMAAQIVILIPT